MQADAREEGSGLNDQEVATGLGVGVRTVERARRAWCQPGPPSAHFVRCLEDVLDLYAQPVDPRRPQVCFDETSKALRAHARSPTATPPGRVARAIAS